MGTKIRSIRAKARNHGISLAIPGPDQLSGEPEDLFALERIQGVMTSFTRIDENGFRVYTCPGCESPSHPSIGCQYSANIVFCRNCTLEAGRWIQNHTNGKGRRAGLCFYDHVGSK